MQNLFAEVGPEIIGVMIPVIAIVGGFAVAIVNSMQNHQRKMAEIIHGNRNSEALQAEIDSLRKDVSQLQSTVTTQALALEGLSNRRQLTGSSDTDSLSQRLS